MANHDATIGCAQARSRVSDYLDNDLEPVQRPQLEAHLEHCSTCPPLYASLVGVHELVDGLYDRESVIAKILHNRMAALRNQ